MYAGCASAQQPVAVISTPAPWCVRNRAWLNFNSPRRVRWKPALSRSALEVAPSSWPTRWQRSIRHDRGAPGPQALHTCLNSALRAVPGARLPITMAKSKRCQSLRASRPLWGRQQAWDGSGQPQWACPQAAPSCHCPQWRLHRHLSLQSDGA